MYKKGNFCQAK